MLQYLRDLYEGVKDMLRDEAPLPPTPRPAAAEPAQPTSAKPMPSVPLTTARANLTLPPLKNWAHPFGDKSNPLVQLTNLAKAVAGYYPVGVNGLWHGGVHFDSGTASAMDQSHARCLADGEVVAYRIATQTPVTAYHTLANEVIQAPFASGFVLVRHHLQAPTLENSNDTPPSLIFYSLYMHLQDWASYEGDPKITRPAFWKSGSYRVKADATDPGPPGASVHAEASPASTVLKTLPRGTVVTISGTGDYQKLVSAEGIELPPLGPQNPVLGYVRMDELEDKTGRYRVKDDALGREKGEHLNIHGEAKARSKVIATLPRGTAVLISGEGEYRKLESVLTPESTGPGQDDFQQSAGYVRFSALEPIIAPHQLDTVAILQPPIAVKAGALIGHLGPYQSGKPAPAQYKLHLETFTAEDLPKFFQDSRTWAQRLPEKERTWLKLPKGTHVITAEQGSEPPSVLQLGTPSGYDLLVPRSLLEALRAGDKHVVAGEAYNWYRLDGLLHDAADQPLDGWVCERVGITPWVSPWHWVGYDTIRDTVRMDIFKAHNLYIKGSLSDEEAERLRPRIDARDKSPVIARLYEIIDTDRNGDLSPKEIQTALAIPAKAQSISQLAVEYESEWHYRQAKWDELDDVLGHTPSTPLLNWMAEKQRIQELKWWSDVAGRVGLPEGGQVYHLHPVGLVTAFTKPKYNEYKIYQSGFIEFVSVPTAEVNVARYVYFDRGGLEFDFGLFKGVKATRWIKKNVLGNGVIYLVNIKSLGQNPVSKFGFRFVDTDRTYVSMPALASLIGALMEVRYSDISSTGFSDVIGSPGVSETHINGENGDFRFLRMDKSGERLRLDTDPQLLDESRQGLFNEALYKFGWKSMFAWNYLKNGQGHLLPRTVHLANHHHHLHVGSYQPDVRDVYDGN